MSTRQIGQCGCCIYWDRSTLDESGEEATAACVRHSPQMDFRTGRGYWPITAETDMCGDFFKDEEAND